MIKDIIGEVSVLLSYPRHLVLLAARVVLAYGFLKPALLKLHNMKATAEWFDVLAIPLPTFFAYLVTGVEAVGIVLLVLGLYTRYISILLSFVMMGAIFFVHGEYGYSVADNGIEIPLYYLLFLFIFTTFGAGKYALDNLLFQDVNDEQ